MCGEQWKRCPSGYKTGGSPPRVRGTDVPWKVYIIRDGITPACAGNRTGSARRMHPPWDHPRVCGEQFLAYPPKQRYKGSPPRVRGTAPVVYILGRMPRITPACAGNSVMVCDCQGLEEDHPRVCGEQILIFPFNRSPVGSPPRVRGTGPPECESANLYRITPACAGNR